MPSGLRVVTAGVDASIWLISAYMCKDLRDLRAYHVLRSARIIAEYRVEKARAGGS